MKKVLPILLLLLPVISSANGAQNQMLKMALDSLNYKEAVYWLEHGADPNGYVDIIGKKKSTFLKKEKYIFFDDFLSGQL